MAFSFAGETATVAGRNHVVDDGGIGRGTLPRASNPEKGERTPWLI